MTNDSPVARLIIFVFAVAGFFAARAIRVGLDLHGALWGGLFGAVGVVVGIGVAQLIIRLTARGA